MYIEMMSQYVHIQNFRFHLPVDTRKKLFEPSSHLFALGTSFTHAYYQNKFHCDLCDM